MGSERGQSTVEWVGMLSLVSLLLVGVLAMGVRVPGTALADSIFEKLLCAVSMAGSCGDEPHLIAAYGTEVGKLADDHMPSLLFEKGSRALPVNFRRCRDTACADGPQRGLVRRSHRGLPVAAFVHVIDCRPGKADSAEVDCSGDRAGNLYVQYWTYYANSATLRGVPIVGRKGFHEDDWESVQIRVRPDGSVDQRASSHHGYNYAKGISNAGSDTGIGPLKDIAELVGARARNGWGPETRLLLVSGGSHAGNSWGPADLSRVTPGDAVHLIPLEKIAAMGRDLKFAIGAPWLKHAWRDPEAEDAD
ncbi:MAG TPA: hypothetical protein VNM89_05710 [Solirubrobacterales bacterium]|nr:hypothetical protein [Solirubrobacterales bacterium]